MPALALLLVANVCALFARAWLELRLQAIGLGQRDAVNLSFLIVPPILFMLLWPVIREHGTVIRDRLRPARLNGAVIARGIALGFLLRLAYWAVLTAWVILRLPLLADGNANPPGYLGYNCPPGASLLLQIVALVITAPIIEEIINRGWILHWLLRYGQTPAIILSALLFAIYHVPATLLMAFCFGIFAAKSALNSGQLWTAVFAHMTFNGLQILDWICLRIVWIPVGQTVPLRLLAGGSILVAIAAAATAFWLVRRRAAEPSPDSPPRL